MEVEGSRKAASSLFDIESPACLRSKAFGHAGGAAKSGEPPSSGSDGSELEFPGLLKGVSHFEDDGGALFDFSTPGSLEGNPSARPCCDVAAKVTPRGSNV